MKFNILTEALSGKTLNLRRNGFVVAPEKNFSGDGSYFRGYYYDPNHTGDKRFFTSKLVSDGEVYVSVRYYNPETGYHKYFDDLNGVDYYYAMEHIKDLTDKIDEFKAKLDAGDLDIIELSQDQIDAVEEAATEIYKADGGFVSDAVDKAFNDTNLDPARIRSTIKDSIAKHIKDAERNAKSDNPMLVKVLAKQMLNGAIKLINGIEGKYDNRGRWQSGKPPISIDDAIDKADDHVYISSYSPSVAEQELIDAGVAPGSYWLKNLTDANQEKVKTWLKNKLETLYDFD